MPTYNLKVDIVVDGIWNDATLCACIAKAIRDHYAFRSKIRHLNVAQVIYLDPNKNDDQGTEEDVDGGVVDESDSLRGGL